MESVETNLGASVGVAVMDAPVDPEIANTPPASPVVAGDNTASADYNPASADGNAATADGNADDAGSNAPASPRRSRAEQSRINGARSRGPTSDAGKSVAAQNAWKHGLRARGQLLPDEDPAVFDAFVASFRDDLGAVGPCQVMLAERVAEMAWKLQRMPVVRSAVLCSRRDKQCAADGGFGGMDTLGDVIAELRMADANGGIVMLLQRYESQIERSMQAALRELRILQGGTRNSRAVERQRDSTPDVAAEVPAGGMPDEGGMPDGGGMPEVPPVAAGVTEHAPATIRAGEPATSRDESRSAADSRVRSAKSARVRLAESDETPTRTVAPASLVIAGRVEGANLTSSTGAATFHPDDFLPAEGFSRVRLAEGLRGRIAPDRCDHYGRGRSASRRG